MQHTDRELEQVGSMRTLRCVTAVLLMVCAFTVASGRIQAQDLSTGSLNVSVVDTEGALIPGATLVLKDLGTNDVHNATTRSTGDSTIPFLNPATYSLIVSKSGFSTSKYGKVTIQTNQVKDIKVTLKVGATSDTVTVTSDSSPIFDTDGPSTTQRLETTQEMTVQIGELDASKGGTSVMDIGFLSQRGTNNFHGQIFEDYRSEALNANGWNNNNAGQKRALLIINDFGASVGGPLIKDKLFFFVSLGNFRQPNQNLVTTTIATPLALTGVYTYANATTNAIETTNVLNTGASAGCPTCTNTINPIIAGDLANIQSASALSGATLSPLDLNHNLLRFYNKASTIQRFPNMRVDYNATSKLRFTGAVNESNGWHGTAWLQEFRTRRSELLRLRRVRGRSSSAGTYSSKRVRLEMGRSREQGGRPRVRAVFFAIG